MQNVTVDVGRRNNRQRGRHKGANEVLEIALRAEFLKAGERKQFVSD